MSTFCCSDAADVSKHLPRNVKLLVAVSLAQDAGIGERSRAVRVDGRDDIGRQDV